MVLALVRARLHRFGLALAFLFASAFAIAVPNPVVTGPIPANAPPGDASRDYPWMATMHNLAAVGYVEEEFFYEGTANRYLTTVPFGSEATVRDSGHAYRTRMIVRRPASAANFNGTVIVEWQNVTAGYDLDAMWGASYEHFIRSGYAWVGVSAQRVGVQGEPNGVRNWSPTRYGTLDVTARGTIVDDALSYDIFAQGMQALRHPVGVSPLGPLQAQRVLAIGASQSASRLQVFINTLHGRIGSPVDAYLVYIGGGRLRTDIGVPVFKLISETDVPGQVASRQADTPMYRSWEVAGSSHSGRRTALNSRPLVIRDGVAPSVGTCTNPPYPRVPIQHVTNAVYDHLVRWVRDGIAPPSAQPITTVGATIQRDAHGNAKGGVRLPDAQVPTALNSGANTGSAFCVLYGSYLPFAQNVIDQLYPTHGSYVAPVQAQLQANLQEGVIVPADAELTQYLAAHSVVGKGQACGAACRAAMDLVEASHFYLWTSGQVDRFSAQALNIVKTVARADGGGNPQAAYASARRDLQRYVEAVRGLQAQGRLSAAGADELAAGAQAVLAQLP